MLSRATAKPLLEPGARGHVVVLPLSEVMSSATRRAAAGISFEHPQSLDRRFQGICSEVAEDANSNEVGRQIDLRSADYTAFRRNASVHRQGPLTSNRGPEPRLAPERGAPRARCTEVWLLDGVRGGG